MGGWFFLFSDVMDVIVCSLTMGIDAHVYTLADKAVPIGVLDGYDHVS